MTTYAWKIDSTNAELNTMQVTYTFETKVTPLNLPIPALGVDVSAWIDKFAPRSMWEVLPTDAIVVGAEGLGVVQLPEPEPAPTPEPPNVSGSVNEEYLRALIFQVLQEVQDAQP
jgi:hypothetical protein